MFVTGRLDTACRVIKPTNQLRRVKDLSCNGSIKPSRRRTTGTEAKLDFAYLPHLIINESFVAPGEEWMPKPCEWTLIRVVAGNGYWIGSPMKQEVPAGAVILLSAHARGTMRASLLAELVLHSYAIEPRRLGGLLTLDELRFLEGAGSKEEFAIRIFAENTAVATSMKAVLAEQNRNKALFRLQLLEVFISAFGNEINGDATEGSAPRQARERLEVFLRQTCASELLNFSLADLARMARCTTRHLNRIFNEVVGTSFREKHTEIRLTRACELLATTKAKVVDVALESGYQSLSLFNLMFIRRFGVSPGKWRENQRPHKTNAPVRIKAPFSHLFVTGL